MSSQALAITAGHLAPHRAIYEMSLGEARSGSSISAIDGRMVFEFTGSECNGYSLNMRMVTRMTDTEGDSNLSDLRSSTWEQGNGDRFRFQSAQYINEKLGDVTMGRAARDEPGKSVTVRLSQPTRDKLDFSPPILFPTQHSQALIAQAVTGKTVFQAKVYDGSEKGKKVYDTTAFIGDKKSPGSDGDLLEEAAQKQKLGELPSWPISIGYFDLSDNDLTPSYQIDFRLYENGVSRNLLIDYGEFTVQGRLSSLEYLSEKKCK
ncbi:MAG: cell envelope integrity EipB family protein [Pseudomonadota bacterium]